MAPITSMETYLRVRPMKVMACVCGLVSLILLIVAIASTAWLESDGYRQGLWEECFIGSNQTIDCHKIQYDDWLIACAVLCLIGLGLSAIGTILCAIGLSSSSFKHKFKFYKASMYFFIFAALVLITAQIVFPVMFLQDVERLGRSTWFFGWAYGVAWGATVFVIGAAILLIIDKDTEEIFYAEKTYYPETETEA